MTNQYFIYKNYTQNFYLYKLLYKQNLKLGMCFLIFMWLIQINL